MIRVLNRFKVAPGQENFFVEAWSQATEAFREEVPGALGSQLFRARDRSADFIALARWSSWEHWEAFRHSDSPARDSVMQMLAVSELVSSETFEEVKDLLKVDPVAQLRNSSGS